FVYDANQRLCKRIEPETGASYTAYDAASNPIWTATGIADASLSCNRSVVPAASQTTRTFDARNRVLTVNVPNSTDDLAYSYYNDGALHTLSTGTGAAAIAWSYAYDLRRLPTIETLSLDGRSRSIGHAYDAYGHEQTLTYPDGLALNTAPNALGQPTQAGPYATGIGYFPNGGMSGFSYHNGIIHSLTQNTRELPLESRDQKPGQAAILDDTYTYDADGNVAAIADGTPANGNSRTMAYDGLDRLTQTNAPNQWWISATTTYDALDNIRSNQVGNTAAYLNTYAYDPTTWHLTNLAGRSNWTLAYDANGNITGKGAGNDSYVFDAANRMTQVTGKESYRYDGHGRRAKITRASDGKLDYPIYSLSGQLITEDDQRSNTSTDYVSLNGSLVAKRSAPMGTSTWTTTYEHTDALRSPSYETNASATLTRAERYTPYGEPGDGQYVQGPGYTGHVTDAATRLTYAQQRYYDPVCGCFLSPDPNPVDTTTARNFNRYNYAAGNPYKFTDPDGRVVDFAFKNGAGLLDAAETMGYLAMSPTARGEISQIANSKQTYTLSFDNKATMSYNHDTRTVNINPTKGLLIKSSGKIETPALGGGHEISHAAEHDRIGTAAMVKNLAAPLVSSSMKNGTFTFTYGTSVEEARATSVETKMGKELGDNTRQNYHDSWGAITTKGPLSTESK
ncbi:MAG: RHS repeat-associated core domain-containing protein, partial [Proteobacteria bacterium]|nr:RHS repeat-associated core domain-containing protein [Pseudomonadota bacterium]